ncbi:hypothetical protein GCM10023107_12670 [Actinoplanes octamycinicus]
MPNTSDTRLTQSEPNRHLAPPLGWLPEVPNTSDTRLTQPEPNHRPFSRSRLTRRGLSAVLRDP